MVRLATCALVSLTMLYDMLHFMLIFTGGHGKRGKINSESSNSMPSISNDEMKIYRGEEYSDDPVYLLKNKHRQTD